MRASQDNQPQISFEENVSEENVLEENVLEENVLEENVPKSFEYVQPPESKKSFNSYNKIYFLAYKVKFQIFFGWTFIPFYFIVDQEEGLSNKELLLKLRKDHKYRVRFIIIS